MSRSYETQGVIHSIGATTEYGSNGFTKREFVIKLNGKEENPAYPNYAALELIKDKCSMMDSYKVGDAIKVTFNISGRLWQGNGRPEKCFTSLQAWKIQHLDEGSEEPPPMSEPPEGFNDYSNEIPF